MITLAAIILLIIFVMLAHVLPDPQYHEFTWKHKAATACLCLGCCCLLVSIGILCARHLP